MGSPIVFSGSFAKLLKDDLKFSDTARIITISVDPTAVATDGESGSIAMRDNGSVYIKQDNGVTVNWSPVQTSASTFTADDILVGGTGDVLTNGTNVLVDG